VAINAERNWTGQISLAIGGAKDHAATIGRDQGSQNSMGKKFGLQLRDRQGRA
jgi:hypothetical protein